MNAPVEATQTHTLHAAFAQKVRAVLGALEAEGHLLPGTDCGNVTVEPPRDPSHGDLSTNAAMVLAKAARTKPRDLAQLIVGKLAVDPLVERAEIAGPGFINLALTDHAWREELGVIARLGDAYGRSDAGAGRRVNIEYVSANPTGPMHMGHCRGAVVGDALANLLEAAGWEVVREYYVNDAGAQVDTLARSAYLRYREALGEDVGAVPEGLYPGDYLKPVGAALADEFGDRLLAMDEAEWLPLVRARAIAAMLDMIQADLALLGIEHDVFASEAALLEAGKPQEAERWLREHDLVYDGVLEPPKGKQLEDWEAQELPLFRATRFGDDQDRPIRKADGGWTYFGADLAYHMQKADGVDALIDIWGADHAGTVKRIQAAVAALAEGQDRAIPFDVKLIQMVQLMRGGEPVKMSKRSGSFVTLAEVVEEVGRDVVRFTMLTRKPEAQMEFDFARVVEASKDNPVFYVQYAHARIRSVARKAVAEGVAPAPDVLDTLDGPELDLVRHAAQFPRVVEAAAAAREPHRIAFYLYDLAAAFHAYWNMGNDDPDRRVLVEGQGERSGARLFLCLQMAQVIRNGLGVLGVRAVEEM